MAATKYKLGRLIPEPANFRPNRTLITRRWVYKIDDAQKIAYRQPKHWDDPAPSGFFTFSPARFESAPKPSHWRKLVPTLKRGIAVPTLSALLIAGVFLVLYPLYPSVKFQVQKQIGSFGDTQAIAAPDSNHNRVIIPKIGVDTTILEGASLDVLKKHEGVWHQRGQIAGDNLVLSGHRFKYLPPNTSTLYNLGEVAVGDTIYVDWYGTRLAYSVSETKRINQNDTAILNPTSDSQLTIYTCYDKRQTERIVVIAKPQP
ncbi:MAG TPA: sortase [Candidatus Saccharimonadales bacterium]|nr:sortase [Candidatus Saccharimonadales bacterium]